MPAVKGKASLSLPGRVSPAVSVRETVLDAHGRRDVEGHGRGLAHVQVRNCPALGLHQGQAVASWYLRERFFEGLRSLLVMTASSNVPMSLT